MRIVLFLYLFILQGSLFAQITNTGNKIRILFIKQNYLSDEAIKMNFSIINMSGSEQTFILSDIFNQSISLELRTSQNELVSMYPEVEAQMNTAFANPSLYRRLMLTKGESYSKILDLRDFYPIDKQGTYYIKVNFYPNPDDKRKFYTSEFISFFHTPSTIVQRKINDTLTKRKLELQKISKLLPNEIIASLFDSQLLKDWEKFLLYIDFERLINSFDNYAQQYNKADNGISKLDIIEQFKRFLTTYWDIPIIAYDIKETIIKDDTAYVTIEVTESISYISRRLRYVFTLYKTGNNTWLIEDYSVLSLN